MTTQTIPTSFQAATRINSALTVKVEKQALLWMAHRAPAWVTSDGLTGLGLLAQVFAGIAYAASGHWRWALLVVNLCLVLNWFGDSLDGTLARVRNQQRPRFGFYVDHMVDVLGAVALMTGLGTSGLVHWPVAMAMLVLFLVLAAESYLATYTLGRFQLSQGIFGPTEIRLLLFVGNLALLRSPWSTVAGHRMLLFDLAGTIAAAFMFATAALTTARHTRQLFLAEPLPIEPRP